MLWMVIAENARPVKCRAGDVRVLMDTLVHGPGLHDSTRGLDRVGTSLEFRGYDAGHPSQLLPGRRHRQAAREQQDDRHIGQPRNAARRLRLTTRLDDPDVQEERPEGWRHHGGGAPAAPSRAPHGQRQAVMTAGSGGEIGEEDGSRGTDDLVSHDGGTRGDGRRRHRAHRGATPAVGVPGRRRTDEDSAAPLLRAVGTGTDPHGHRLRRLADSSLLGAANAVPVSRTGNSGRLAVPVSETRHAGSLTVTNYSDKRGYRP